MDESYGEHHGKEGNRVHFSFGEFFRTLHPVADVLIFFLPRFKCLKRSRGKNGTIFLQRHLAKCEKKKKNYDLELIFFVPHPLFFEFFSRYYKNIRDVFFDKLYTKKYVDECLGKRYKDIIKEVYNLNKHRVKTPLTEFFETIQSH